MIQKIKLTWSQQQESFLNFSETALSSPLVELPFSLSPTSSLLSGCLFHILPSVWISRVQRHLANMNRLHVFRTPDVEMRIREGSSCTKVIMVTAAGGSQGKVGE